MTSTLQTASNLLAKATTTEVAAALPKPPSWFAHLPSPVSKPAGLSIDELHAFLEKEKAGQLKGGVDWIVVDVRRTDIEVSSSGGREGGGEAMSSTSSFAYTDSTSLPRSILPKAPNDYFIPSAVNLAAQTFYQTLPALYPMLSK